MAGPPEKRANSSKRERRLARDMAQTLSMRREIIIRRKRLRGVAIQEGKGARWVPPKHLSVHRNRGFGRRPVESRDVREGGFSGKIVVSGLGDARKPGESRLRGSSPIVQKDVGHDSSRALRKLGSECLYLYPKHGRWRVTS